MCMGISMSDALCDRVVAGLNVKSLLAHSRCRLPHTCVIQALNGDVLGELPKAAHTFTIWTFHLVLFGFHRRGIPDGSRFAVVGESGDIRVWNAETYELHATI